MPKRKNQGSTRLSGSKADAYGLKASRCGLAGNQAPVWFLIRPAVHQKRNLFRTAASLRHSRCAERAFHTVEKPRNLKVSGPFFFCSSALPAQTGAVQDAAGNRRFIEKMRHITIAELPRIKYIRYYVIYT